MNKTCMLSIEHRCLFLVNILQALIRKVSNYLNVACVRGPEFTTLQYCLL